MTLYGTLTRTGGVVNSNNDPPVLDRNAPLATYWNKPVSELAAAESVVISKETAERHYLYSLLVAALVFRFWNGNKHGQSGNYPWREAQRLSSASGIYEGGQYLGHNIACLGVDGNGEVIDFDFNHNDIFSSSVEHAESRLVRRVFSLAQVYDDWHMRRPSGVPQNYLNILSNVTIYTSLESCAQCSGIMALGSVKSIVYLQRDPGQYAIGNILRNLTTADLRAPLPISADNFDFHYYKQLNDGYREFYLRVSERPFYIDNGVPDRSQSITSFLCTDFARGIFKQASEELNLYKLKYPKFKPSDNGQTSSQMLTNEEVLKHLKSFYEYASICGRRGTAHKL